MPMIVESGFEAATNADALNGTRLATAPANGKLTLMVQAADNVAANHFTATVQLPGGDNPLSGVLVPAGATAGLAGILNSDYWLAVEFGIQQGGQVLFSLTETGDTECSWRAVFVY